MAERSNGEEKTGRKKGAGGRSPAGKGKSGKIGVKKPPQPQQRKPKVEMELKRKKDEKKEEKVVQKESKSRQKKKEEVKISDDGKKKLTRKRIEDSVRKTKGEAAGKEQVKKRTKTKGGTTVPEDKRKRSRNKMENGSSPTAGDDEERGSASCSFPMSRVRRLMRLEGGNFNVVNGISSDAVFLVNKASEMFLEKFVEDSYGRGIKRQKKSLNYKDLSSTVHSRKQYEFLSDFVPEKLRAEDALKARTTMET